VEHGPTRRIESILIAGLGSIGRRHLALVREVLPKARILVLRRPQSVSTEGPGRNTEIIHDIDDALAAGIDAAIIANPATLHLDTALPLAHAGVHLLIEKPISNKSDGIEELIAAAAKKSAVLQVGYCLRFDPSLQALRAALVEGRIGRPLGFQTSVGQYLPDWRPGADYRECVSARADLGGGALLELSHEIDYVRWILGEITSVAARLRRSGELEIDVEDVADRIATTAMSISGTIHLDMLQRLPVRDFHVYGDEGTLIWDGISHETRLLKPDSGTEIIHAADKNALTVAYRAQFEHYLDAVADGTPPLIGGEEGRKTMLVIEAARRASRDGRVAEP
jgi:predicted dehydrogenase